MATRLYGLSTGEQDGGAATQAIAEGAGSATAADTVEVTVDLATTAVHDGGTTRGISRQEFVEALERIIEHVSANKWPPA